MSSVKKNLGFQMTYTVLSVLTPLITSPIISRALGADGLGVYSATQAYANYFMFFAKLGVDYYGQRSMASVKEKDRKSTFWEIYTIQLAASVIAIVLYYLSIPLFNKDRWNIMVIQGIWIISSLLDINWFFFGIENFKLTVTRNITVKILTVSAVALLIRKPSDLPWYAIIMAGSTAVSQLMMWHPFLKKYGVVKVNFRGIKKHIKPILGLFLPIIALSVYHYMDKTMLDWLSTENEVGYYYAADKLINIPLSLITAVGTVMLPRITNAYSVNDDKTAISLIEKSSEMVFLLASAVGFGIASIAKEFVPFFFGKGYDKCVLLLFFFVPVLFVKSMSNVVNQEYLIPTRKDTLYTRAVIAGAFTNLLFNLLLIPKLGALGATIGTFAAEFAVLVYGVYCCRTKINFFNIFVRYFVYIIPGVAMFFVVRAISGGCAIANVLLKLIIMVSCGALTYLLLCLLIWLIWKKTNMRPYILLLVRKIKNR